MRLRLRIPHLLPAILLALLLLPQARADYIPLWSIGDWDGDPQNEYGDTVWGTNSAPGSATAKDHDFYFAGAYPAPVGTVAVSEPVANLEANLASGNSPFRFHFNLTPAQAVGAARIRLNFHQVWGGWWNAALGENGEGYGTHVLEVRWNGTLLKTETHTRPQSMIVEANAGAGPGGFTPAAGENIIEIHRVSAPPSSPDGGVQFDALSLEIDPEATLDSDGDGLPRWWERDHGLSDASPADAAQDPDLDGLTNAQEFAKNTLPHDPDTDHDGLKDGSETGTGVFISAASTGTNPLNPDTDGDTLKDGEELALSPQPNPLLADTDGDTFGDAWEVKTGCNPASATSKPPPFAAAIGIQFVCELDPLHGLPPAGATGLFPQINWNRTWPLRTWDCVTGNQLDIAGPVADTLVNSAGVTTPMTMAWSLPASGGGGAWASGNGGSPAGLLLGGYLNVNEDGAGVLSFTSIPYATYDVIVYVGSNYDGARGHVRLNDNAVFPDRHFISTSTRPQSGFVEPLVSSAAAPWRGNAIRFRNVTGGSLNVKLFRKDNHEVGFHGIQIVNLAADTDGDSMPDAWEFAHQLRADFNDSAQDPDGDGLSNAGEHTRQTHPRLQDTDGDGLNDNVETNTGAWVSATNTGTAPLVADTDGDGLTDGVEAANLPAPTNPHLADTDGDGRSDAEEIAKGTNPVVAEAASAHMPVVTTGSPRTFDWTLENVQIVWDHTRGHVDEGSWRSEDMFSLVLANSVLPDEDALYLTLPVRDGRMSWFFHSKHGGAFSHPSAPDDDIYDSDWGSPPQTDLRPLLGFSGHGTVDISDRLRFRVQGTSTGSASAWNITFTLTNQDAGGGAGQTLVTRTFNNCTLAASVHNNTAAWQDRQSPPVPNRLQVWTHAGVQVFFQSTPLENTPAFAPWKDTDEDGIPDAWEDSHGLNKNSAADAALDPDLDGLTTVQEYLTGTLHNDSDTDNDLVKDSVELQYGSDPLVAASKPPFANGTPGGLAGEDFNNNGMPDAWEQWAGSFALDPTADNDSDGMTNAQEAAAGTNPFDPASHLWSGVIRQGNDLTLRWPVVPLKTGRAWQSQNLTAWTQAAGSPVTVGGELQQTLTGVIPSGPRFYAARLSDVDSDGDGVSDWTETHVLGSSLNNANSTQVGIATDTNGDGTPDGTLSGDYATLIEQLQGADGNGGFAGGGAAAGISRPQAARFLMQATFGPTVEDIERVRQLGYTGWINEQIALPPTLQAAYIKSISKDLLSQRTGGYNRSPEVEGPFIFGNNMMTAFARAAVQGEDQLRQRVAFALSQILVTSRRDANLENRCLGMADYYDIFVRHAFGSYKDVLMEVTMHPVMGRYLSHVGNQKADPSINRYPDENYARECMQLFSIGLWELNPDGSRQLDLQGHPIPTYSNTEITQLARVMTGFWFGGHNWGGGGWTEEDYATPMTVHAARHDFGLKTLLHGFTIPARAQTEENALRDIHDAMHHLFTHPNTGVYIGRQLIQFLVTDNPSPAYVQRIGAVFADNGSGLRGDLGAVVKAILLDAEARNTSFSESANCGRLKEPVIRAMAIGRAFGLKDTPGLLWWDWNEFGGATRQEPTYSPSVFNYYRPDYRAPGLLTQNNLAGPVFQITDSYSAISLPNRLWQMMEDGFSLWETYRFPLDLTREKNLAATPDKLVDHLNTLFCAGRMKVATRNLILAAINQIPAAQPAARARVAAYLAMVCPEGAVMK